MSININDYTFIKLPKGTDFDDGTTYKALKIKDFARMANIKCGAKPYYLPPDGGKKIYLNKENIKKLGLDAEGTKKYLKPHIITNETFESSKNDKITKNPNWIIIDVDDRIPTPDFCSKLPFTISMSGKRHYYAKIDFIVDNDFFGVDKFENFKGDLLFSATERENAYIYFPTDVVMPEYNDSLINSMDIIKNVKLSEGLGFTLMAVGNRSI